MHYVRVGASGITLSVTPCADPLYLHTRRLQAVVGAEGHLNWLSLLPRRL